MNSSKKPECSHVLGHIYCCWLINPNILSLPYFNFLPPIHEIGTLIIFSNYTICICPVSASKHFLHMPWCDEKNICATQRSKNKTVLSWQTLNWSSWVTPAHNSKGNLCYILQENMSSSIKLRSYQDNQFWLIFLEKLTWHIFNHKRKPDFVKSEFDPFSSAQNTNRNSQQSWMMNFFGFQFCLNFISKWIRRKQALRCRNLHSQGTHLLQGNKAYSKVNKNPVMLLWKQILEVGNE